jgi:hypothetical protein
MAAVVALVRLCAVCGAAAQARCERCALPVCEAHHPPPERRCADCEADFRRRRPARVITYAITLIGAALALVIGLFFLVLATGGGALGVAPLILFSSIAIILHRLEQRARGRFLAERRRHPLPQARLVS